MTSAATAERLARAGHHLRRTIIVERWWANAALYLGAGILAVYTLAAILAPWIAPHKPDAQDLLSTFEGPSVSHLMGTDQYGSDVFSRVLYGLRVDLVFGVVTTYIPMVIGMLVGAWAGYHRGVRDSIVMRLADLTIAMPFIVLVLAIVAIVGPGIEGAYIGIMIVSWALYARLTRTEMMVLREQNFIAAAQGLGYSNARIILRHALPNLIGPNLVFSMADIVLNILVLAGLSFLGVGVQPPSPELGAIIAGGQPFQLNAWWITTLPGLALVVLGVGFSLVGDAFADRFGGRLELPASSAGNGADTTTGSLLEVSGLFTAFPTRSGVSFAVNGVGLTVAPGECLGIVGESGSGKSMTCRSILGLVPRPGAIVAGSVRWRGQELVGAGERRLRRVRGAEIGMIFQDPAAALNPVYTIGGQIVETIVVHTSRGHAAARRDAVELLARVGIPSPAERAQAYPHELSGGMRQRAMIALAIACGPALILADEPTTNLDVTIQDQILHLLADLRAEQEMAMILVSHDLGVVTQSADRVAVMYAGYLVEEAPTRDLFRRTRHPYTRGLMRAVPSMRPGSERDPLVPIEGQPPELDHLEPGCPFQPRCPHRRDACAEVDMALVPAGPAHVTACPFGAVGDA